MVERVRKEIQSLASERSEPYRFSASKDDDVNREVHHRQEDGDHRYGVRRQGERYKPRHDHESHLMRAYKEPPRDWYPRHSRSYNERDEGSHHTRLTRDDARHRISTQNRNDHLNASRDRRIERRDETSSTKITKEQSAGGNPLRTPTKPTQHKSFDDAMGEVREAMTQFTRVADPSESAARRDRMRRAEEAGEFEAVAAGIVQHFLGAVENSNQNNDLFPLENLTVHPEKKQKPKPKLLKESQQAKDLKYN
ncbi:hypothetical protein DY000_02013190 [Brassica cretica]|uniref:Uncharacterized protein n=1 Tax=Brassica cretica TaxID=69181 RepID=A0ABQ7D4C5_BRACR|nr:hypothetical protein DY000_02013190 [Brassica cretica]